jgi:hypothetical protein
MRLSLHTDRLHPGVSVTGTLHLDETTGSCKTLLLRPWWAACGAEANTDEDHRTYDNSVSLDVSPPVFNVEFSWTK